MPCVTPCHRSNSHHRNGNRFLQFVIDCFFIEHMFTYSVTPGNITDDVSRLHHKLMYVTSIACISRILQAPASHHCNWEKKIHKNNTQENSSTVDLICPFQAVKLLWVNEYKKNEMGELSLYLLIQRYMSSDLTWTCSSSQLCLHVLQLPPLEATRKHQQPAWLWRGLQGQLPHEQTCLWKLNVFHHHHPASSHILPVPLKRCHSYCQAWRTWHLQAKLREDVEAIEYNICSLFLCITWILHRGELLKDWG